MSILSANQKKILKFLSTEKSISEFFYLTGGTALAEFYLRHRLSEDLDFFSEREFGPQAISTIFKKIQKRAGIKSITYEQSFNRNLFFLDLQNDSIKTEFTYFPFPRIEIGQKIGDLHIDSLIDIAVNKLFAIYQKPRLRDFIDLYLILRKEKTWSVKSLINKAKIKFDHHIVPLQLSSQFIKVEILKDYPIMIENIREKEYQSFFLNEAKILSESELE